jgi:putative nucleotidyltransferase with HDIG domain
MSEPVTGFLTGLAQAVSTMSLYKEGHPARERAIDLAHEKMVRLQERHPTLSFTFLGHEIVFNDRPLKGLKRWDWGHRLAGVGIQRFEIIGPVTRGDLDVFLDDAHFRLSGEGIDTSEIRQTRETAIRYGVVGLEDGGGSASQELQTATLGFTLGDEIDAVEWLHDELQERGDLHLLEADAIVRSLSVAMHGDQAFLIPLLKLKRFDQYTTTHAMNVSVLSMALAEFIGLAPKEVKMFGISGLLHDLGKVTIPQDILNKPGKLTDQERLVMNNHTIEGARIILETEEELDLAAVVAYEHHIKLNGGGYPSLRYPRACHQASNIVHVCDVFDALRTDRPYREAWPTERALGILEEGAGPEFDPHLAHAFIRMMNQWESRVAYVEDGDESLPLAGTGGVELPPDPHADRRDVSELGTVPTTEKEAPESNGESGATDGS